MLVQVSTFEGAINFTVRREVGVEVEVRCDIRRISAKPKEKSEK